MSEPYQIISIKPEGLDPPSAVRICHDTLASFRIGFDEDSLLLLESSGTETHEPVSVVDPTQALDELAAWPALGSLVYEAEEGPVTVTYDGSGDPPRVQVVIVSTLQRAVDRRGSLSRYEDLARALHEALGSRRTIMEWGLEASGFNWRDEVLRLQADEFSETYTDVDLRA